MRPIGSLPSGFVMFSRISPVNKLACLGVGMILLRITVCQFKILGPYGEWGGWHVMGYADSDSGTLQGTGREQHTMGWVWEQQVEARREVSNALVDLRNQFLFS